jgi:hypothetical protein
MSTSGQVNATGRRVQLPTSVDLRHRLPQVKDQGGRGTCLAFAVTAAHEAERAGSAAVVEDLSEEVLYWGSKQIDGNLVPGSTCASANGALNRWGQPDERLWPYDPHRTDTDASYAPPLAALDPTACYRTYLTQLPFGVDEIRRYLALGRTVLLGLQLNDVFDDPPGGLIPMPTPRDRFTDGHALLVVGYADATMTGDGTFMVRNSWGDAWGDGGYGYLPYQYLHQYGGEVWLVGAP